MYKNSKYAVKIDISIAANGIYIFDNESATGKTRLFKELRMHQTYGEPVSVYTYNDKLLGHSIEDALNPNNYKVIMLDRYDMYNEYGADLIIECAKTGIVLIDCKGEFTISADTRWCTIKMTATSIEVTE